MKIDKFLQNPRTPKLLLPFVSCIKADEVHASCCHFTKILLTEPDFVKIKKSLWIKIIWEATLLDVARLIQVYLLFRQHNLRKIDQKFWPTSAKNS